MQNTLSDLEVSKMKKKIADVEEQSRMNEKELRGRIDELSDKLSLTNEAFQKSKVSATLVIHHQVLFEHVWTGRA